MITEETYAKTGARLQRYNGPSDKGAVLICPGGGYELVSPREAGPVAECFIRGGWQAFVLQYNVEPVPLGTQPLEEAAWAMRTIRATGVGRIAACGFSAGGHLAASLGVHWNDAELFPDPAERRRQRPDALILSYPVISAGPHAHRGSMDRLARDGDAGYFSLENHVGADTPPTFLWHTAADELVPVQNSLLFAEALSRAGVPYEMRIFPFGVHGLSTAAPDVDQPEKGRFADPHVARWVPDCLAWLDYMKSGEGK